MTDEVDEGGGGAAWRTFGEQVEAIVESGTLKKQEIDYKLELGRELAEARRAVLAGASDWVDKLKVGLKPRQGHPVNWRTLVVFQKWIETFPKDALAALTALWAADASSVSARIRTFAGHLPPDQETNGQGVRARLASGLLMGLDVRAYPPFAALTAKPAYERTGYARPHKGSDAADLYEHFLRFLDKFLLEAQKRGLRLGNRLDVQSVVWHFVNENPDLLPRFTDDMRDLRSLADDLLLNVDFLEEIRDLLDDKRQVIFQGPPGTGKTYVAQALAERLAGSPDRVTLVQFHPSYAYEDFVRGFRPALGGQAAGRSDTDAGALLFELHDGPLLRAAAAARKEPGRRHFLIIDEINRGNLAKVFGELYFLLEYRDRTLRMLYRRDDESDFSLPENLFLIGTMNTADRSIALVDLALRRRFHFVEFHPDQDPVKSVLRRWLQKNAADMLWVADIVDRANALLRDDRHAAIGPSHFMKRGLTTKDVQRIWKHSVLPYVAERLFGDDERVNQFRLEALRKESGETGGAEDAAD